MRLEKPKVYTLITPEGRVLQFEAEAVLSYYADTLPDSLTYLQTPGRKGIHFRASGFEAQGKTRTEWSPGAGRNFTTPQDAVADAVARFIDFDWKKD